MTLIHRASVLVPLALAGAAMPASAAAQTRISDKIAIEFVGSVSVTSATIDDPFIVLDGTATIRVSDMLDVIIRPYVRRLAGGDTSSEMYQLQMRYQPSTRVPIRVDAGIITSPLGLASLEMRPDRNPVIGSPSYYFTPLPSFDGRFDRVQLLSGGYPLGAVLTASGPRWDVRAGMTDGTPARTRKMFASGRPAAAPQFVSGAGLVPMIGLRIGVGFAHGAYRTQSLTPTEPNAPIVQGGHTMATVFNVEGDYSVGYTRVTGEWIVDHFDSHESRHRSRLPRSGRSHALASLVRRRSHDARDDARARRGRTSHPILADR